MLLITAPSLALADINLKSDTVSIYIPSLELNIKFPSSDWNLVQEKRKPDGGGYYYHLTSESASLNFSVFLDRTNKCSTPDKCRDMFWENPGPKYKGAAGVEKLHINGLSVIRFYIDKPMGYPVIQSNVSAHSYKNGFWIDLHLSNINPEAPDYTAINKFIEEVRIE